MKTHQYKNFLFDFDGTIIDSVNVKAEAFGQIYEPLCGSAVSQIIDHHLAHGGMNRVEKFIHYHDKFLNRQLTEAEVRDLSAAFAGIVYKKLVAAPFIEGAIEFITTLFKREKKLFIVSGSPEEELRRLVRERGIEKFWTEIKGAPTAKHEHVEKILQQYQLNQTDCVLFGDAEEDRVAADINSILFVPVNFYNGREGYKNFSILNKEIC